MFGYNDMELVVVLDNMNVDSCMVLFVGAKREFAGDKRVGSRMREVLV